MYDPLGLYEEEQRGERETTNTYAPLRIDNDTPKYDPLGIYEAQPKDRPSTNRASEIPDAAESGPRKGLNTSTPPVTRPERQPSPKGPVPVLGVSPMGGPLAAMQIRKIQNMTGPVEQPDIETLKYMGRGLAEGLTVELPKMIGGAAEFAGRKKQQLPEMAANVAEKVTGVRPDLKMLMPLQQLTGKILQREGKVIKDVFTKFGEKMFGESPDPEEIRELDRWVYEGSKMLAPSAVPAGVTNAGFRTLTGLGKLVKAAKAADAVGDVAKATRLMNEANKIAKMANKASSASVASMFGLSQAQDTYDVALERAAQLEREGDYEGAAEIRQKAETWAPIATGAIEAGGEYLGTKYLGKLLGLDEAEVLKKGAKNLAVDFMKNLGVEVSTEVGQSGTQGAIEKETGIRPDADPLKEALDVVGPTAFMTLLTGGVSGGASSLRREPSDESDGDMIEGKKEEDAGKAETEFTDLIKTKYLNNEISDAELLEIYNDPRATAGEKRAVLQAYRTKKAKAQEDVDIIDLGEPVEEKAIDLDNIAEYGRESGVPLDVSPTVRVETVPRQPEYGPEDMPDWIQGTGEIVPNYPGRQALPSEQGKLAAPEPGALGMPSAEVGPEGAGQFAPTRRGPLSYPSEETMPLDVLARGLDPKDYKVGELKQIASDMGIDIPQKMIRKSEIIELISKGAENATQIRGDEGQVLPGEGEEMGGQAPAGQYAEGYQGQTVRQGPIEGGGDLQQQAPEQAGDISLEIIDEAAQQAATSPESEISEPTEAQIQAGNYKKGHINLHGLDISIENPRGSERKGTDKSGKPWSTLLKHHYGYIRRTDGADGDQVDVFVGPNPESEKIYVIDQVDPESREFDEHKVMMGFENEKKARIGYLSNYEKGWKGLGSVREMDIEEFKKWIRAPREIEIPEIKDTNDAVAFAKVATDEQLKEVEARKKEYEEQAKKAKESGDFQAAMDASFNSQFMREVLEARAEPDRFDLDNIVEQPEEVEEPQPVREEVEAPEGTEGELGKFKKDLETKGSARVGRVDYSIQENDNTYYYSKVEDGVRLTNGPGYPASWSRPEAIRKAVDDAQSSFDFEAQAQPAEETETTEVSGEEKAAQARRLGKWVRDKLKNKETISWQELFKYADMAFKGTQAQGKYTPKEAYDAMELGVNMAISDSLTTDPSMDEISYAEDQVKALNNLIQLIPTQSKRTAEADEFQQFSTPPPLAFVAVWGANIQTNDTFLEPSAGNGGVAVLAENAGANTIIVNELADRRFNILKEFDFDRYFQEDASQLNNILPKDIRPTVIVMNPPFSATAGRIQGRRQTKEGARHIEQALARLEPGGRLVAIVGEGMADDAPAFRTWWKTIKDKYAVRANIGISGKGYAKYGTTFDNQLLIIDKIPNKDYTLVKGKVDSVEDVLPLIKEIRDDRRTQDQRAPGEPGSQEGIEESAPGSRTEPVILPPTGGLGIPEREGGGRLSRPAGELGRPVESVEPEGSDELSGGRPRSDDRAGGREESATGSDSDTTTAAQQTERDSAGVSEADRPAGELQVDSKKKETEGELSEDLYEGYRPERLTIKGSKRHPTPLVQSAAMAAVSPPKPTYKPSLPENVIKEGRLSDIQIESVVYAGQAHEDVLPDGARRGYFIGDGTGVGKGREIAAILWDNWNKGRKKAIWISEKKNLFKDAKRDVEGAGWDPDKLFDQGKTRLTADIKTGNGILFTTYDTLKMKERREGGKTRLDQVVEWFGRDFDGVIAFDESHNMGNAIPIRGQRGQSQPSEKALAGVELQRALPNARVIYVSATGATEVVNLAYADRLGLWGEGTAFPDKRTFIDQISAGGVAAMELVARDMKAMGVYNARSLSYDGVGYERITHNLSPKQVDIYNTLAEAWQVVLRNINDALELTGVMDENGRPRNSQARTNALTAFWGAHQRFFNQIITSMQTPAILKSIHKDLEQGNSAVIQLVSTLEAAQERALSGLTEDDTLEDLDLTPRDGLMQLVQRSFPVYQYEEYADENGNIRSRIVTDSQGNPVENSEAVALREELLDRVGGINVPEAPINMIIDEFGHENVAEVTGRSRRVITKKTAKGTEKVLEKWSRAKGAKDTNAFMNDKKRILIFSEAGGTGRSYHSDLDAKNQRKRSHYLLQAGWRADKAVQGLGRTHRSNQKHPPQYYLVTTDLKGQKRFISSIARRLDQLGALTKGQRQTGSQGIFEARDNLESDYAIDALRRLYEDMYSHQVDTITIAEFEEQTGLSLRDARGNMLQNLPPIRQFMNRLLSLNVDTMNSLFDEFSTRMDDVIRAHAEAGTLDQGLETLKADKVEKVSEETVREDERSGSKTKYVQLDVTNPARLMSYADARKHAKEGFFQNVKSGKIWAVNKVTETDRLTGEFVDAYVLRSVTYTRNKIPADKFDPEKWEKLSDKTAKELWQKAIDETPKQITHREHLITGILLPIWDRLSGHPRIMRVQTTDGERMIGRLIPSSELAGTLRNIGAEAAKVEVSPEEIHSQVLDHNYTVELANGWKIVRRRVSGEERIEITGPDFSDFRLLERHGVFSERIQWKTRYFVPASKEGVSTVEAVVKNHPVVSVNPPVINIDEPTEGKYNINISEKFPTWYSALERGIDGLKMNKAPAKQWLNMINKLPVKQEEMEWTGVEDWLKQYDKSNLRIMTDPITLKGFIIANGPKHMDSLEFATRAEAEKYISGIKVSKQDILDYVRANNVQVQEVEKGAGTPLSSYETLPENLQGFIDQYDSGNNPDYDEVQLSQDFIDAGYEILLEMDGVGIQSIRKKGQPATTTKYHDYQVPGGENYKELLLTLPLDKDYQRFRALAAKKVGTRTKAENEEFRQLGMSDLNVGYRSSHWDEPNVLAHVRFNERTGPNGEKILFVEEIQSDLHQEGRKKGYITGDKRLSKKMVAVKDGGYYEVSTEDGEFVSNVTYSEGGTSAESAIEEARRRLREEPTLTAPQKGVPDAPFKKSWPLMAFKRMVRYAAENGFDTIAWTPGEVQAERYDLSKHVRSIEWKGYDSRGASKLVEIDPNEGNIIELPITKDGLVIEGVGTQFDGKPLDEVVGKEIADKILSENHGSLSGKGLKVGGEGMKGFYDKILPSEINKFFNKKAWGKAKVGTIDLVTGKKKPTETGDIGAAFIEAAGGLDENQYTEVWSLPITEKMRDKAFEGMPLFSLTPEQQDRLSTTKYKDIQKAFPGSKISPVDVNYSDKNQKAKGYMVTLPNGIKVVIDPSRDRIMFNPDKVARDYKISKAQLDSMIRSNRAVAMGMYAQTDGYGFISLLSSADPGSLSHEKLHMLMDLALSRKDKAEIYKRYGTEEKAAEAFRRREGFTRTFWEKIKAFIERVKDVIYGDVFRPVFDALETNRPVAPARGNARKYEIEFRSLPNKRKRTAAEKRLDELLAKQDKKTTASFGADPHRSNDDKAREALNRFTQWIKMIRSRPCKRNSERYLRIWMSS